MSKFLFSLVLFASISASAATTTLATEVTCRVPSPTGAEELLIGITSQYDTGRYALLVRHILADNTFELIDDRKVTGSSKNEITIYEDSLKSFTLHIKTLPDGNRIGNLAVMMENGALAAQNIKCTPVADTITFVLNY